MCIKMKHVEDESHEYIYIEQVLSKRGFIELFGLF